MTKKISFSLLAFMLFSSISYAQTILVERPAIFPLDDQYAEVAHEALRFGNETYMYSSDFFTLEEETTLLTADFFGEKILGFYQELPAFSVYIFNNSVEGTPSGNPNMVEALVHLEQIQLNQGVVVLNDDDDRFDVRVDFTQANNGNLVTLPVGDYWMIAAAYGEDADAGDPTLSWTWRFSSDDLEFAPQHIRNQFSDTPDWEPTEGDAGNPTAMAWTMTGTAVAVGLEEEQEASLNILPNPSSNSIRLEMPSSEVPNSVVAIDGLGRQVRLTLNALTVDVSMLKNGVYTLRIETVDGNLLSRPFIKN